METALTASGRSAYTDARFSLCGEIEMCPTQVFGTPPLFPEKKCKITESCIVKKAHRRFYSRCAFSTFFDGNGREKKDLDFLES